MALKTGKVTPERVVAFIREVRKGAAPGKLLRELPTATVGDIRAAHDEWAASLAPAKLGASTIAAFEAVVAVATMVAADRAAEKAVAGGDVWLPDVTQFVGDIRDGKKPISALPKNVRPAHVQGARAQQVQRLRGGWLNASTLAAYAQCEAAAQERFSALQAQLKLGAAAANAASWVEGLSANVRAYLRLVAVVASVVSDGGRVTKSRYGIGDSLELVTCDGASLEGDFRGAPDSVLADGVACATPEGLEARVTALQGAESERVSARWSAYDADAPRNHFAGHYE